VAQRRYPQGVGGRAAKPIPRARFRGRDRPAARAQCGNDAAGLKPAAENWPSQAQRRSERSVGDDSERAVENLLRVPQG